MPQGLIPSLQIVEAPVPLWHWIRVHVDEEEGKDLQKQSLGGCVLDKTVGKYRRSGSWESHRSGTCHPPSHVLPWLSGGVVPPLNELGALKLNEIDKCRRTNFTRASAPTHQDSSQEKLVSIPWMQGEAALSKATCNFLDPHNGDRHQFPLLRRMMTNLRANYNGPFFFFL